MHGSQYSNRQGVRGGRGAANVMMKSRTRLRGGVTTATVPHKAVPPRFRRHGGGLHHPVLARPPSWQATPPHMGDPNAFLAALSVRRALGSGSNGAVLQCELEGGPDPGFPDVPPRTPLAVKVVSHFWDEAALDLLSCERMVYTTLPPHENVVRVYAQFMGDITEAMLPLLPPAMAEVCPSPPRSLCHVCVFGCCVLCL